MSVVRPFYFWDKGKRYHRTSRGELTSASNQTFKDYDYPSLAAGLEDVRRGEQPYQDKKRPTVTRPFYIGSANMLSKKEQLYAGEEGTAKYSHATLDSAIEAAQGRLKADKNLDVVSIVKIVRVVRRAKPVVTVDIEVVE